MKRKTTERLTRSIDGLHSICDRTGYQAFVDKCIIIRSHYLTTEKQKEELQSCISEHIVEGRFLQN